ncbi:hypothetical protein Q4R49_00405, partial [Morganella morganii subsp. sibonii]
MSISVNFRQVISIFMSKWEKTAINKTDHLFFTDSHRRSQIKKHIFTQKVNPDDIYEHQRCKPAMSHAASLCRGMPCHHFQLINSMGGT